MSPAVEAQASCRSGAPRWSGAPRRALELVLPRDEHAATRTPTRCGDRRSTRSCSKTRRHRGPTSAKGAACERAVRGRPRRRRALRRRGGRSGGSRPGYVVDASGQAGLLGRALGCAAWDPYFRTWPCTAITRAPERLPEPDETQHLHRVLRARLVLEHPAAHRLDERRARSWTPATGRRASRARRRAAFLDARRSTRRRARGDAAERPLRARARRRPRLVLRLGPRRGRRDDPRAATPPASSIRCSRRACTWRCRRGSWRRHTWRRRSRDGELAAAAGPVYQRLYSTQYYHFRELAQLFYASNRTVESYFWEVRRVLATIP